MLSGYKMDSTELTNQNRFWEAERNFHVFGGELIDKQGRGPPIEFPALRGRENKYRKNKNLNSKSFLS